MEKLRKMETITGLEMALRNANLGIESMTLADDAQGDYIKVDFINKCYPTYYINITASSPQGIIIDVIRFIEEKKYKC